MKRINKTINFPELTVEELDKINTHLTEIGAKFIYNKDEKKCLMIDDNEKPWFIQKIRNSIIAVKNNQRINLSKQMKALNFVNNLTDNALAMLENNSIDDDFINDFELMNLGYVEV